MNLQDMKELGGISQMKISDCVNIDKRVVLLIQNDLLVKFGNNKEINRNTWTFKKDNSPVKYFKNFQNAGWIDRNQIYDYIWPNSV